MAKMIKDTQKNVHPVTGEEGNWVKVYKTWIDPKKAGDQVYKGMTYHVKGGKIIRDREGNDITHIFS